MDATAERAPAAARAERRLWAAAFAVAAAVYLLTAQRSCAWQDSGIFQWRIHTFDLKGFLGLALAHPLLIALGRAAESIPLGPPAWRLNAVSALAGAVAVANLALLVRRLAPPGESRLPVAAIFAAGAFGLAHTVWWLATITESHALVAALLSAELLALTSLLRRPRVSMVVALGLLNGLGVAAHNLALLALPAYGLAVIGLAARRRLRWWAVGAFVAAWCAGASLLLGLVVAEAGRSGLGAAIRSALFGRSWQSDVMGFSWRAVGLGLGYALYNLPHLALPLAAVGLWRLRRRVGGALAAVIGTILAAHFLFAIRYTVQDQFMFFVPLYLLTALLAGLGLAEVCARRRWLNVAALASLALAPAAYALAPSAVRAMKMPLPGGKRQLPYRDAARYWLTPWKSGENSAERFARDAVGQLAARDEPAILYGDLTAWPALKWVAEVEGQAGGGVRLVSGLDADLLDRWKNDLDGFWADLRRQGASLWVVSNAAPYCPAALKPFVAAEPTGVLYRVEIPPP